MRKRTLIILSCIMATMLTLTACGEGKSTAVDSKSIKEAVSTENVELETETVSDNAVSTESESTQPVGTESIESTESETESEPAAQAASQNSAYTYTDTESVMYAKSSVNVRDLPSTKGAKLGGLSQNQEITVTGTCNETGWYRIAYKESIGYVSNKYLVSEKVAAPAPKSNTAASNNTPATTTTPPAQTQGPITGTIVDGFDISTDEGMLAWLKSGHSSSEIVNADPGVTQDTVTYSFDRAAAEEIFALVNADRTAAGIPALTWSEDLYNIAMQRCNENDGHAGMRAGTSENLAANIYYPSSIHDALKNSQGHYDNYMNGSWSSGAVAVRRGTVSGPMGDGITVCYEVFQ